MYMDSDRTHQFIEPFKRPEIWIIASVVLVLPPAYFWLFGLLSLIGISVPVAGDMLERMPEMASLVLVFILPIPALITSLVSWRISRNGLTLALFVVSTIIVLACLSAKLFS